MQYFLIFPFNLSILLLRIFLWLDNLGRINRSKGQLMSTELTSVINCIHKSRKQGTQGSRNPVDEIMTNIIGKISPGKDSPGSSKHGIHGRSSCWEDLNQNSNRHSRQGLLNPIMHLAKVQFPVEEVDNKKEEEGRSELRPSRGGSILIVIWVKLRSTQFRPPERIRHDFEEGKGDESSAHGTGDADDHFGIVAFAKGAHDHGYGRVDVLSTTDFVSCDDAYCVDDPC
mmetsp:Transcript_22390/g.32740  ORF Transcript_22390/g.32740 Transcript_22390/m.32740 type:complete len:228 (-) Transcript_22390:295-978(-)